MLVTRIARQFSQTYKDIRFPYNFNGINPQCNYTKALQLEYFINNMLQTDIKQGFDFAFKNSLYAIAEYDTDYFDKNCEFKLAKSMKNSMINLKDYGYQFIVEEPPENNKSDPQDIVIDSIDIVLGADLTRENNKELKLLFAHSFKNFIGFQVFVDSKASYNSFGSISQLKVFFKTRQKLILLDKNSQEVAGKSDENLFHCFQFESQSSIKVNNIGFLDMFAIFGKKNSMPKLQNILFNENLQWKITDIDFFLQGNPFI